MTKRASLQKQSFSAPRLVAKLFRVRRSGRGLTLRRRSACFMAAESSEHQHHDEEDSFFQNRLFLTKRFPFGNAANCGRTFCTARPPQCQEIRYSHLPGIMQRILSDTGKTSHQLLQISPDFARRIAENMAVRFWRFGNEQFSAIPPPFRRGSIRRLL
jgi:hypothetical protein